MMLRWMNRDYRGVAALVSAVGTDAKYEEDEMQIFKHLGRISDPHPDSHANRSSGCGSFLVTGWVIWRFFIKWEIQDT